MSCARFLSVSESNTWLGDLKNCFQMLRRYGVTVRICQLCLATAGTCLDDLGGGGPSDPSVASAEEIVPSAVKLVKSGGKFSLLESSTCFQYTADTLFLYRTRMSVFQCH